MAGLEEFLACAYHFSLARREAYLMSDMNKRNLLYFEGPSMRQLYSHMEEWQQTHNRRLLSISIQKDGSSYCCIALTNPTEVVITSADGANHADVSEIIYLARGSVNPTHTGRYALKVNDPTPSTATPY
jgi:hypothetical protein